MNTYIDATGWTLLHFLWQGCLIGGALAVALAIVDVRRVWFRCAMAHVALATVFLAPAVTFVLHLSRDSRAVSIVSLADLPISISAADRAIPWMVLAWGLWILAQSLRFSAAWLVARRRTRVATFPAPAEVAGIVARFGLRLACRISHRTRVPELIGVLRPVLVLPASTLTGLPPAQLEAVIAHEVAHITRGDHWINLGLAVAEVLFGFHPGVRYVASVIRREREFCCDDAAVKAIGDPVIYARALLALEENASGSLALAATGGQIGERIERLFGRPSVTRAPAAAAMLILLTAGAALAYPLFQKAPSAPAAKPKAPVVAQPKSEPPRPEAPTGTTLQELKINDRTYREVSRQMWVPVMEALVAAMQREQKRYELGAIDTDRLHSIRAELDSVIRQLTVLEEQFHRLPQITRDQPKDERGRTK